MRKWILSLIMTTICHCVFSYTIDIKISASTLQHKGVRLTLDDCVELLKKSGVEEVTFNHPYEGDIILEINEVKVNQWVNNSDKKYPVVPVEDRSYQWEGRNQKGKYVLTLHAVSEDGISAAIYGLLQEVLQFNFYHPRQTQIPQLKEWPLRDDFTYRSQPRFNKMGFHLHTMHPIELTEALLDENYPDGEKIIREYIDWLARNRQNYMEFCLLESINRKTWPSYAKKWVDYMKDRGIISGLDLSLHMKQQYAFKLYRNIPKSFKSKESQILERFQALTQADWKYWNVEFSETEFTSGNAEEKTRLRKYVHQLLHQKGIHLTGREHVVKPEKMVGGGQKVSNVTHDSLDAHRGTMIHTVMFYTLNDTLAPVYGNHNLQHMREMLLHDIQQRETWYYPESAYWVTFDASIPMFLTPYLNGRLEDILYCQKIGVEGHLTFTSGWEWSYWLIDWSIANWSWTSIINGQTVQPYPEQYFDKIISSPSAQEYFKKVVELQQQKIKNENLMAYLTAMTVTDEMPFGKNLPFHPKPPHNYEKIRNSIPLSTVDSFDVYTIPALQKFAQDYYSIRKSLTQEDLQNPILKEIIESLDIVAKRSEHRASTLKYLLEFRKATIQKNKGAKNSALTYLSQAKSIRKEALKIVRDREKEYRYPLRELAYKKEDHTAYQFGYLYPVHDLHFWEREELQAQKNKWKFWYRNIWNIWRIMGIIEK